MCKFKERIRHSLDKIEIERSVELLQETRAKIRSGRDSEAGVREEMDLFQQINQPKGPVAIITTHISTDPIVSTKEETKDRRSRFGRFMRVKQSEGTEVGGSETQG